MYRVLCIVSFYFQIRGFLFSFLCLFFVLFCFVLCWGFVCVFVCLLANAFLCRFLLLLLQREEFDARRAQLNKFVLDTRYANQKDRLRQRFEAFLSTRSACPPPLATAPSLLTATPVDVVRFLHNQDQNGRTQVHVFDCAHFGLSGLFDCGCPRHFAAGTVDSYVGQLRAVFNSVGRHGRSNPCDSDDVKNWVKACAKEQQRHRVPVKQAKPTFSIQLRLLIQKIDYEEAVLPVSEGLFPRRFPLLRDRCFFLTQWFSGDRAGDLGRALTKEVVRLEDGSLLYNHTVGKTIRSADGQLLVVPRVTEEPALCPVLAFDRYVAACRVAGLDLRRGYLFPPTASPKHLSVRDAPFSAAAATKRLRVYLPEEELTAHGARSGCAITLLMLGASVESVQEHCKWASAEICRHYTKLERVRRLDSSARLLQTGVSVEGGVSDADSAAVLYELLNSGFAQEAAV